MARSWITDRWVKDALVAMPDGTTTRISPTSAQLRAIKTLPDHFRTAKFGKGSRWVAGWYEPDGAQRQRLFARRTDAESFTASLEDDIRSDRYIDPSAREQNFTVVAEAWLASKSRIKDSTWRRYRRELDNYVLPMWGARTIGSITRPQIDAWVQQLRDATAPHVFDKNQHIKKTERKPVKMAPAYLGHIVRSTFGGALRYAVAESLIGRNPLANVELPRTEGDLESDLPSLSFVDIEELADTAFELSGREDDRELLQLLAYSGPRIGEATALKVKDLDPMSNRARVHRTWTVDRDGRRKLGPVKTWEKRWLPIPAFLMLELVELTKGRDPEEFLFTTVRGAAVDGSNWYNRVWLKVRAAAGLAIAMSVHDLRHVAATNAIAAGADVKLVQQMLGHKDATETLNTYAHLWPDRVNEVIAAVEKRRAEALAASAAEAA
ncbi:tyrosine-type recombinase/integrase [Microbacterium allomyrinae]|uniref:Tyrosine-type recombinase/integrase family protein n=1 Tax=Microbacterium allomyrinae TaxID=2830666 RepID=A0A9X1S1M6_9MICO|nr:tyrosine-type recombinase/integrase [Microbacterium allomyrinae]MCC2031796.1 tyrosine-type recombinase/integrase family protein [Microbacterium allomyrinae]